MKGKRHVSQTGGEKPQSVCIVLVGSGAARSFYLLTGSKEEGYCLRQSAACNTTGIAVYWWHIEFRGSP